MTKAYDKMQRSIVRITDNLPLMSDEEASKVAWAVIRTWADRGSSMTKAMHDIIETDAGGPRHALEEVMAQMEDI